MAEDMSEVVAAEHLEEGPVLELSVPVVELQLEVQETLDDHSVPSSQTESGSVSLTVRDQLSVEEDQLHVYVVQDVEGEVISLIENDGSIDISQIEDIASVVLGEHGSTSEAAVSNFEEVEVPTEETATVASPEVRKGKRSGSRARKPEQVVPTLEDLVKDNKIVDTTVSYMEKKSLGSSDIVPYCRIVIPADQAQKIKDGAMKVVVPQDLLPLGVQGVTDIQVHERKGGEMELVLAQREIKFSLLGSAAAAATHRPVFRFNGQDKKPKVPIPHPEGYQCPICQHVFRKSRTYVTRHIAKAHKIGPYKCTVCSASFPFRVHLENHVLGHEDPKFACRLCDKKFANKYYLTRHMLIHSETKEHACPKCGKEFLRKDKMKEHLMAVHNKQIRFICSQCNQGFYLSQVHARHEKNCIANGGRRKVVRVKPAMIDKLDFIQRLPRPQDLQEDELWHCDRCSKTFPSRKDATRHVINQHPQNVFKCEFCGRPFRRKAHLKDHITSLHSDRKPFQCMLCGKELSRQQYLDNHLRTQHGRERQEACEHCGALFRKKRELMRHLRTVHGPNALQNRVTSEPVHSAGVTEEVVFVDMSSVLDVPPEMLLPPPEAPVKEETPDHEEEMEISEEVEETTKLKSPPGNNVKIVLKVPQ